MNAESITTYTPDARISLGWIRTWITMFANTYRSRELIWQLFKRDFLMQYKRSFFGMGWLLISPVVGIVSWVLMNATGILNPGDVGIPYPAYVLLSSTIWGLFGGYQGAAAGTLGAGSGFITQVNYPHEALLAKQLLQHTASFAITLGVNVVVLLLLGVAPSPAILLLPIAILPIMFLGAAIGLMIGIISTVAPDVSSIFGMFMGFVFYITPVVYSPNVENHILQTLIQYNPLTYLIGGVRDLVIYGRMERFDIFMIISVVSFVLFLIALRLFYVSENKIIEKMG